jgi:hypothetical protein
VWGVSLPRMWAEDAQDQCVTKKLNTLLTALYVLIDDHVVTAPADAMWLRLLRPNRKDETYRNGNLGGVRQWIESVNQTLKGQLDLESHGGRTPAGVFTRVAH